MSSAKEGCFLLIGQGDVTTLVRADPTLRVDPSDFEDSVDSEGKCRPVNEGTRSLVRKNGPEEHGDDDRTYKVGTPTRAGIMCNRIREVHSGVPLVTV